MNGIIEFSNFFNCYNLYLHVSLFANCHSKLLSFQIEAKNKSDVVKVADWSTQTGYTGATNYVKEKFPRFFRIGTVKYVFLNIFGLMTILIYYVFAVECMTYYRIVF